MRRYGPDMPRDTEQLDAWIALPRRLFLDSSTLQTLLAYGGQIFEGDELLSGDRGRRIPAFQDDLWALRAIFLLNERAAFEFVLSDNSLTEVTAKEDRSYLRWALDVLDHWGTTVEGYRGHAFSGRGAEASLKLDGTEFGYLSAKDKLLLRDAAALECDAFLTMEQKLPRNSEHLRKVLGIQVLRPPAYWALLRPWAGLYR